MTRDPAEDFLHPSMPADHELQPSVLYRITAAAYRAARRSSVERANCR
jgi:hypothetical protein